MKIAVDTPSGIICNSGEIPGECFNADYTVSFTALKPLHVLYPSMDHCGKVSVTKIGIPQELVDMRDSGELKNANIANIAVDNISELERCILSDLGRQGKNKGVPAQADYQYMQFKLVNSLRLMKSLGMNVIWTAWEDVRNIVAPDGTSYSQLIPKMSLKIVDNICGLCDVVGKIFVNKDAQHGILLEAAQNIYAKNQIDSRKFCKVEDFMKFEEAEK